MNKKIFMLFSLFVILSMLLAACGGGKQETSQVDTLRVWIQWGDNPQQIQALFDKYTAETGIKVEVTAPLETDKILPALTGSEPPDVLVLSGGDLVKSYYKEGLVDDLNGAITTGGIDLNDFFDAPLNQCRSGDKILCLPWGTDMYALFWNKDLFEAAGLDPETPPATMEELAEFADKLTKVAPDGSLEQIGFLPDMGWDHSDLYINMYGGFWYNEDGTQMTVNSQPVLDALTWQQQFYTKYGVDNVMAFSSGWADTYMSADYPFYTGKLAMYVDGEWMTGPNFINAFKPEASYGVAPFPPPADHPDRANTAVVQGTVAVIPSGAANKEASAKLLAWMMSPEVVAEEFCFNANLPTSKKAAEDPCFTSNPKFKVFTDLISSPNAKIIVTTPISLEFNDAWGLVIEQVLHAGMDPKPILDDLQAEFEVKLADALK
ncbi:MAG TPA: extracellular solute-binding protein [Anaerolineales bacterium]|nr:extracellular solute-binding protein [Anaerolineales bacterium]